MIRHNVQDDELDGLLAVATDLAGRFTTVEATGFQQEAAVHAAALPRGLRRRVIDFRAQEASAVLVVTGLPVDDAALGPTPLVRGPKPDPSPSLVQDIAFYLIACLLGEPIAWATQQSGYVMHDVYPVEGHEHEQIGWGSEELLEWHTEDAFHPLRTDYLGLMCLRNTDRVETTVADMGDVDIPPDLSEELRREQFFILPDDSHRAVNGNPVGSADDRAAQLRRRSQEQVERLATAPEPVAVLFGDPDSPYVRIDPFYMRDVQGKAEAEVLGRFIKAVDKAITGVVLEPGDICFIDNYRAVHGRKPFRARYDGTDRWLRRLNVARDLRKSRASRLTAESRTIF